MVQVRQGATPGARLDAATRRTLTHDLEVAARSFGFHCIAVFSPGGTLLAGTARAPRDLGPAAHTALAARLARGFHGGDEVAPSLTLPLPGPGATRGRRPPLPPFEVSPPDAPRP